MSLNLRLRVDGTVQTWSVSPAREFRFVFFPVILYLLHPIADSIAETKGLRKTFKKTHDHRVQFSTRLSEIEVCKIYVITHSVMPLS